MELKLNKSKITELLGVFILFALVWYSVFLHESLWSSGFHFMDDHNYVEINHRLNNEQNIHQVAQDYINRDLRDARFRPLYQYMWVAEIAILGANYNSHLLLRIVYLLVTCMFLYGFARSKLLDFSILVAAFFVFFIFWGDQLQIYYLFGSGESRSLIFASVGLYFLVKAYEVEGKTRNLHFVLAYLLCFASSFCKESFITFIPAFVAIDIFLYKRIIQKNWFQAIFDSWKRLIPIVIALGSYAFFLLKFIGTQYGPQDYKQLPFVEVMASRFFELLKTYGYGIALLTLIISYLTGKFLLKSDIKKPINSSIWLVLDLLIVLIPILALQVYVYRGYGFSDKRYLIPSTIYIGFMVAYLIENYYKSIKNIEENKWLKHISVALLLVPFCLLLMRISPKDQINSFAGNGRDTQELFKYIKENTHKDSNILICPDISYVPSSEDILALEKYIPNYLNLPNKIYFQPIMEDSLVFKELDTSLKDYLLNFVKRIKSENKLFQTNTNNTPVKNILIYAQSEGSFQKLNEAWFDAKNYQIFKARGFIYYSLKK